MVKIISLFARNYDGNRQVRDEVVPGAEWVQNEEGIATRKWDGTCCMIRNGFFYKRYDAKAGKTPPSGFEPAQPEPDANTGHWPGWLLVGDSTDDRWHREGRENSGPLPDGTYELVGPKINGNPDNLPSHVLIPHGREVLLAPRDFDGLRRFFETADIEGIVWHHEDGRMVKIKAKDFGIKRK
jgi:hypothetical protein